MSSQAVLKQLADRYGITVFWSDEDDAYISICPEFEGHSAHGPTPADAAREGRVALEVMIEGHLEANHDLPDPRPLAS